MQTVFRASKIFTGYEWLEDHAVITGNGVMAQVLPQSGLDASQLPGPQHDLIVPAFIDAQVYGAAGRLFSVYTDTETLQLMNDVFVQQGTVLFVPTLATNTLEIFKKAIDAVKEYWEKGGSGVHGLHLEGPWLNVGKRGAHIQELIHAPEPEEVSSLLEYGKGVIKMITIAPETCSPAVMDVLRSHSVVLSAGHSNAICAEATKSFGEGISTVTHLYNAMSPLHHREPGLVGAVLDHDKVRASIIPDGHHVDYAAVSIAKKIMKERLFAITDAVTETHSGPYQHQKNGDKYECNGVLSGSALSMHQAFLNLVHHAGVEVEEALRMCSLYPAQVLGCDDRYGKIAPQYAGQFLLLDKQLKLEGTVTL